MPTPLRLLIVEDSEDDAQLLVRELRRADYDVTFERADTPALMAAALAVQPWDLIISDYTMPHLRGTQALELLKKCDLDIPFIFVSGTIGEETAVAAMKSGAQDYLVKGQLRRLIPAVERELREAEIRRAQKRAAAQVEREQERLRALHDINRAITSTLDLRAVLYVLLDVIEPLLPASSAIAIELLNQDSGVLEPAACRNIPLEDWKAYLSSSALRVDRKLLSDKTPIAVANVQRDTTVPNRSFFHKHELVSFIGVPLIAKENLIGIFALYTKEEHRFSTEEVQFLTTLADQAAVAIHNAQLYEQIKRQAAELEKVYKAKAEFLSIMSHELRTPLSAVLGYTDILYNKITGEMNPEQEKLLAKIMARSKDISTIINSMLEVTRLEAGAIKVDEVLADLGNLLSELRYSYDAPLENGLTLLWDYPPNLPMIKTDRVKLKHILQNLINNAIKFTHKGSITVSACVGSRRTKLEDDRWQNLAAKKSFTGTPVSEDYVEFSVADTGIGIPRKSLPLIFDMFCQGDRPTARSYEGVGLGLYIVRKYTELLGGKVAVESEPGKGSRFLVYLPIGPSAFSKPLKPLPFR